MKSIDNGAPHDRNARLREMVPGGILELHGEKVLIEGLFSLAELQTIVEVMKEAARERLPGPVLSD